MKKGEILKMEFNSEEQVSSFIMDHLKPIEFRVTWEDDLKIKFYLEPFKRTLELLDKIGEIEHTGDWDPNLRIGFLMDDTREVKYLESDPGYWQFDIEGDSITIENMEYNEETEKYEDAEISVAIRNLFSIEIIRN